MIMQMIVTMVKMYSARHPQLISYQKLNKKLEFENRSDRLNRNLKLLTSIRCSLNLLMEEVKKLSTRSIDFKNLMARLITTSLLSLSHSNLFISHRNQSLHLRKEEIVKRRY
jgi:hypothetical protein